MKNLLLVLLLLFFIACDLPKDPKNSYKVAKTDHLLVGITINPPFTEKQQDSFYGEEVNLVTKFAKERNLKIKYVEGSESDLVKKAEKYKLHLVIGGFDKKTNWKKKVGLSAPYDKKHVIMVPKGENKLLQELETFILNQKNKE